MFIHILDNLEENIIKILRDIYEYIVNFLVNGV